MQTTELFSPISANMTDLMKELEKPQLINQFNTGNKQVLVILTESYLVLCQNIYSQVPSHFCKLNFTVKSEFLFSNTMGPNEQVQLDLSNPIGFIIQRQECSQKITLYSSYTNILDMWMIELEKKINQRNFHKLFKAKKKIGKGAFATVYLAQRLRNKQMVAVKAFSKQKQYSGDKGREALENQINLMRHVNHSSIMRLEGVYETQNSIYVILQYLDGVQLNEVLKSGKLLSSQEKTMIIKNLLKGLQYLNDHRIIHRDLKPQNIMFRSQDSYDAVICDFGLATFADAAKYLFVRCGTPGFVAPQIINIKDMTTKSEPISDVFSAGLIFHYLLFGCSIFPGKKYNQILNQNRSCQFDFTSERYKSLSPQQYDLLTRMLQKDASKRISARDALNHSFFNMQKYSSSSMDIQSMGNQNRSPFQQLSNYSSPRKDAKQIETMQTPSMNGSTFSKVNYTQFRPQNNPRRVLM